MSDILPNIVLSAFYFHLYCIRAENNPLENILVYTPPILRYYK